MDAVTLAAALAASKKRYAPLALPRRRDLPGHNGLPATMTTPPTVTAGTAGTTTSSITSAQRIWPDRKDSFSYSIPWPLLAYGTTFPDTNYLVPLASAQGNAGSAKVTPAMRVSFYTDAPTFEIISKSVATYRLFVDGQAVTASGAATMTHANNQWVDVVDFTAAGGRVLRRIDVDFANNIAPRFGGIYVGPLDTVFVAPQKPLSVCAVSASYGEGTGATSSWSSWVQTLAALGGWTPWSSSWGGTGYLNPNTGLTRVKVRDRLTADVLNGSPDMIVWGGDLGYNDQAGGYTAAAVGAEALLCYQAAKAALPNVQQVVCGPWWHHGARTVPTTLFDIRDAIKASAASAGALFVDLLEMGAAPATAITTTLAAQASNTALSVSTVAKPSGTAGTASAGTTFTIEVGTGTTNRERRVVTTWTGSGPFTASFAGGLNNTHAAGETVTIVAPPLWTGTGRVGATAGDGNCDLLVSTDNIHPTQAGHDAIARALFAVIAAALGA